MKKQMIILAAVSFVYERVSHMSCLQCKMGIILSMTNTGRGEGDTE